MYQCRPLHVLFKKKGLHLQNQVRTTESFSSSSFSYYELAVACIIFGYLIEHMPTANEQYNCMTNEIAY